MSGIVLECLCDQQDSHSCPKASQKTAKCKCAVSKVPFFLFLRYLENGQCKKICKDDMPKKYANKVGGDIRNSESKFAKPYLAVELIKHLSVIFSV